MDWNKIQQTYSVIQNKYPHDLDLILVLGSGLGKAVNINPEVTIPYSELPHFAQTTVSGHAGELILGTLQNKKVAVLSGRFHPYEGHNANAVVYPLRVLAQKKPKCLVVTNAAGGINQNFRPGDLVSIKDHLNLTGLNPLVGENDERLGTRFPDMGNAYTKELRDLAQQTAEKLNISLKEGVYCGVLGPSYETPAEIKMMRALGADMVGMSTVLEVIASSHLGIPTLGISCITNLAADLHEGKLEHEEVKVEALKASQKFSQLIMQFVGDLK